jgi:predicted TIM-barrel fold metal-dependent hydrolase
MSAHDAGDNVGDVIGQLLRAGDGAALSRRDALRLLGMAGLYSFAGGCAPGMYSTSSAAGPAVPRPVAIDVHTHIFNVRDVPAAEYFINSIAHLGEVNSGFNLAPGQVRFIKDLLGHLTDGLSRMVQCARDEQATLLALEAQGRNPFEPAQLAQPVNTDPDMCAWRLRIREILRNMPKNQAKHLTEVLEESSAAEPAAVQGKGACGLYRPLEPVTDFSRCQSPTREMYSRFAGPIADVMVQIERFLFGDRAPLVTPAGLAALFGMRDLGLTMNHWLRRMARPRYEIARELIRTFGGVQNGEADAVDAFVVAMVDMEHWLGGRSPDSLREQMLLTREIARLSNGRLLPFIAYDPLRDVLDEGKPEADRALGLVRDAISNHGFVGVKLYPANGFRPLGNASLDEDFPRGLARRARGDLGRKLDDRLHKLYAWCEAEGVPIMAHGNETRGTYRRYSDRGNPINWGRVAEWYPGLRINIGHFGGMASLAAHRRFVRENRWIAYMSLEDAPENWSIQILGLMSEHENVYSDVGAFGGVLKDNRGLRRFRRNLGDLLGADWYPGGLQKLMYASDWYMVAVSPQTGEYHRRFTELFSNPPYATATQDFLGNNAATFLGLRRGNDNRRRLDAFYRANGVTPAWQAQVDGSSR